MFIFFPLTSFSSSSYSHCHPRHPLHPRYPCQTQSAHPRHIVHFIQFEVCTVVWILLLNAPFHVWIAVKALAKSNQNMMKARKLFSKKISQNVLLMVTSHSMDVEGQLQDNEWRERSLATLTFHHLKYFHLLTFVFSSHFYRPCFWQSLIKSICRVFCLFEGRFKEHIRNFHPVISHSEWPLAKYCFIVS